MKLTAAVIALVGLGMFPDPPPAPTTPSPGVAWYGDWKVAAAEAQRSQRPIILQFARPACRGVSGVF